MISTVQNRPDNVLEIMQDAFDSLPEQNEIERPDLGILVKLTNRLKQMENQFSQYEAWFESEKYRVQRARAYVTSIAEQFARAKYSETRLKSWSIPNGSKFQLRKRPDSIEIEDESKAIEWAKNNNPDALKTTISKSKLVVHYKRTGEIVPGISIKRNSELSFSLKV